MTDAECKNSIWAADAVRHDEVRFVSRKELAKTLSCSVRHLEDVQRRGVGPNVYDIGGALRYDLHEAIMWAKSRVRSTKSKTN